MSKEKALRIAGYCRTSGEGQRENTSLPRQREDIESFCAAKVWKLVRFYVDESKTGSKLEGRAEFQQMMRDAANGLFDAVVVYDITRFARNGADIIDRARFLKSEFGIFLLDTKGHFDNRQVRNVLTNHVHAGISEHERLSIMDRTIRGRLRRAKEGRPTCGIGPYGRIWNKERQKWEVDETKKGLMEDAAKRYLAGESLKVLAAEYGMALSSLRERLRDHCGPTFVQRFNVPDLDINETVETKVPALLPPHTIKALKKRMDSRRTGGGTGNNKYTYLLGGRVRCNVCGLCLSPQANGGTRYYRRALSCTHIDGAVRADDLEKAVASQLVELLGNPAAVAKAAEAYQAALGNVEEQRAKAARVEAELDKIAKAQDRYLDLLGQDMVDATKVHTKLGELRDRQKKLEAQRDHLAERMGAVPSVADIEKAVKRAKARLRNTKLNAAVSNAGDLKRADREALVAEAFANTTHPNGKWPGGVYITDLPESKWRRPRRWGYELHGNLPGMETPFGRTDLPPQAFENTCDEGESGYVNRNGHS